MQIYSVPHLTLTATYLKIMLFTHLWNRLEWTLLQFRPLVVCDAFPWRVADTSFPNFTDGTSPISPMYTKYIIQYYTHIGRGIYFGTHIHTYWICIQQSPERKMVCFCMYMHTYCSVDMAMNSRLRATRWRRSSRISSLMLPSPAWTGWVMSPGSCSIKPQNNQCIYQLNSFDIRNRTQFSKQHVYV